MTTTTLIPTSMIFDRTTECTLVGDISSKKNGSNRRAEVRALVDKLDSDPRLKNAGWVCQEIKGFFHSRIIWTIKASGPNWLIQTYLREINRLPSR